MAEEITREEQLSLVKRVTAETGFEEHKVLEALEKADYNPAQAKEILGNKKKKKEKRPSRTKETNKRFGKEILVGKGVACVAYLVFYVWFYNYYIYGDYGYVGLSFTNLLCLLGWSLLGYFVYIDAKIPVKILLCLGLVYVAIIEGGNALNGADGAAFASGLDILYEASLGIFSIYVISLVFHMMSIVLLAIATFNEKKAIWLLVLLSRGAFIILTFLLLALSLSNNDIYQASIYYPSYMLAFGYSELLLLHGIWGMYQYNDSTYQNGKTSKTDVEPPIAGSVMDDSQSSQIKTPSYSIERQEYSGVTNTTMPIKEASAETDPLAYLIGYQRTDDAIPHADLTVEKGFRKVSELNEKEAATIESKDEIAEKVEHASSILKDTPDSII